MKNTDTALIMASDKKGIAEFAGELAALGFALYGSRGTVAHLQKAGIEATDIATIVGPPILGHRVVSISREIAAATLARDVEEDIAELQRLGLPRFNLVCVDFYPLEAEIAKPESTRESVIEATDIGGPLSIRSGVKGGCLVICRSQDRLKAIEWLKAGRPDNGFFEDQAARGEFEVSKYCMASGNYRSAGKYVGIFGEQAALCKYGENAWQTPAALFSSGTEDLLALDKFDVVEGTSPSYNNWCDIDRLLQTMTHIVAALSANGLQVPFLAIGGKHGNPCGAAMGNDTGEVLRKMMAGDPLAIFGGLVMANFAIDDVIAAHLSGKMLDGVIAPGFTGDTIAKLRRKGDKCRFIQNFALRMQGSVDTRGLLDKTPRFRYVRGGFLRQPNYTFVPLLKDPGLQKFGAASEQELTDMLLAWAIGSTSNSNTITLVKNGELLGNGVGQQDRVGAAKLAIERAERSKHDLAGAVAYSDSFFPFPDGPKELIDRGVKAILTSSGSVRDKETIALCEGRGVVLYMVPDAAGRGFFGH